MAEQDLDRSEAATPFKLEKAREQGQTARSMDVVNATVFAVALAYAAWHGLESVDATFQLARVALVHAGSGAPFETTAGPLVLHLLKEAAFIVMPFMVALMLSAVVGTVAQTGLVLSAGPLKLDLQRVNPMTGLRRIFSMRTLFDGARACLKLAVLLLAAWYALKSLLPQFYLVAALPPQAFLRTLVHDAADLGLKMALVLAFIAFVDLLYTRREFGRKMRMSRRELKDEHKNRDGDPRIRARLRELRRETLKRSQALRNTRSADVVLTNPTHYAVALQYVHGEMHAPRVVAKGAGQLAARMREIAYRHQIAIVRNPALARRLFRELDIEQTVPPAFHAEVARIIVWVFAMREQRAARQDSAA
ncbi:MAG TPA: EscU/YscU/HrcU family type III secretion system export apparatus switch protein [Ramlibacter sp.]|jgi:flagellar biosynthetic protein FlhB|uniref:EscU/YscU/HrcU family type III secretion system export apparatus switch protein n=1 Tax=Ramlibacter sp. TaxID=1917967 RepID=UPI002D34CE39|nr:EscU/YscU/HrcU family type III secretion system export apparatus switch protein [Ramlibacter sp.]HZY20757.1 EscU/YscU/HrcU family type III secretion system export apparatus switch protein [Ramlibacter sp.]